MAAFQYTLVQIDGFNEQGSLLPLQIHSDSQDSCRTDFGVRASYAWNVGGILLIPSLTAAWEHEYLYSALPTTVGSADFPGITATFSGPSEGHDTAIVNESASSVDAKIFDLCRLPGTARPTSL